MGRPPHVAPPSRRTRRLVRGSLAAVLGASVFLLWLTGCMEQLFYHPTPGATHPPPHLSSAEPVWFESADGTRLHGWFIPAGGALTDGRAPTILHFHGNAGNIESHVFFTQNLPPNGFNVFIFDYRGYGRSEGSARRRDALIADGHAALDALLARPDVDPTRIGMYGQSLGGAIALNVMADRPELRAAVVESPFASWRLVAANAVSGDPPGILGRLLASVLIKDDRRPDEAIARIDRPVLLLHGTADTTVPVSHSRLLAAASPTTELVEIPGGEHNSLRDTHPDVDGLTIDFLRRHLE